MMQREWFKWPPQCTIQDKTIHKWLVLLTLTPCTLPCYIELHRCVTSLLYHSQVVIPWLWLVVIDVYTLYPPTSHVFNIYPTHRTRKFKQEIEALGLCNIYSGGYRGRANHQAQTCHETAQVNAPKTLKTGLIYGCFVGVIMVWAKHFHPRFTVIKCIYPPMIYNTTLLSREFQSTIFFSTEAR